MELDKVAAVMRPRKGVQAAELGFLLGRRFWGRIILSWLILALPLLLVSHFIIFYIFRSLLGIILVGWWLKPLFDRITLHIISRGFFGDVPTVNETVEAVTSQWWSVEALADMTLRRFQALRSVVMPVRVLEGLSGKQRKERIRGFLDFSAHLQGYGLLAFFLSFKTALYISILVGAGLLIPEHSLFLWLERGFKLAHRSSSWPAGIVVSFATIGVTLFLEPFFAAGGFGIYIQRRIEREGWDLELRFRRLARQIQEGLKRGSVWLLIGFSCFFIRPGSTFAEDMDGVAQGEVEGEVQRLKAPVKRELIPVDDPNAELGKIVSEPPFGGTKVEKRWKPKDKKPRSPSPLLALITKWMPAVASVLRILIVAAFIGLGLWAVWWVMKYLARQQGAYAGEAGRPRWQQEILEQVGAVEGVEGDIIEVALKSWRSGEQRRALAILLWTSLLRFEDEERFRFALGWTASHCAHQVRNKGPKGEIIAELARAFDQLAWAKIEITEEQFERLLKGWQQAFPGAGPSHRRGER